MPQPIGGHLAWHMNKAECSSPLTTTTVFVLALALVLFDQHTRWGKINDDVKKKKELHKNNK